MNPFDLRGPEFLLFYLLFGAVVLTVLNITRREREDDSVSASISDPYLIAYLRGGERAVVEAAAVALIDRGLMEAVDDEIRTKSIASANRLEEVEKRLLEVCAASTPANTLSAHPAIVAACSVYRTQLEQRGLLPHPGVEEQARGRFRNRGAFPWRRRRYENHGGTGARTFQHRLPRDSCVRFLLRRLPHQQSSPYQKRRPPADRFNNPLRRIAISRKHVDARHGRQ